MDKKILLSGIAALLIGGSMHATSVSASAISFSLSGEATLSATFSDVCRTAATTLNTAATIYDVGPDNAVGGGDDTAGTRGSLADFLLMTYAADTDNAALDADADGTVDSVDQFEDALDAINGLENTVSVDDAALDTQIIFIPDPCGGASADNPVWGFSKELSIGASGTLANGLEVSFSDTLDLTDVDKEEGSFELAFGGAFGTLTMGSIDSAVKLANVGGDGDISVAGYGFSGHALSTAGTSGYVVSYAAPTMGGMNLYVTYAPSSDNKATNTDEYLDTIAIGASFATDALSISAGWESATHNSNASGNSSSNACDHGPLTIDATYAAATKGTGNIMDDVYGIDECGDQTLMMIGASMNAGDISIKGAYSNLDTDEADRATTSIDLGTSVGDWSLGLGYTTATRSSKIAGADNTQTVFGATLGTNLGDGVDFALKLSNNEYDKAADSTARGGNGVTNDFQAIGELKITY
jgi:predicted porin